MTEQHKITLRKAISSDISTMQEFIFKHGENPWNFLPEKEVKAHIAEIAKNTIHAYLAESRDQCVGFACFYLGLPVSCYKYEENKEKVAYLSEIVVHRDHVGQGIGNNLIKAIKEYLITHNISRLYAERHADNAGSAGVMRKAGFEIIEEYSDEERRPSGSRKTTVTRLKLV